MLGERFSCSFFFKKLCSFDYTKSFIMKKLLFVLSVILLISLNYSCNHENDLQVKGEEASLFEDSGFLD